jgi:hypothetical protein
MEEEVSLSGRGPGKAYRRALILAVMCFMIGVWFLSFPVFDFLSEGRSAGMPLLDALAIVCGIVMIVLGFTIWKLATS